METITYAVDGAVATLTLNRPQVRNAMNGRMIEELRQTLEAVNLDTAVRVLVLRGAGPVFCAGGDLRDLFTDTHPVAIRNLIAAAHPAAVAGADHARQAAGVRPAGPGGRGRAWRWRWRPISSLPPRKRASSPPSARSGRFRTPASCGCWRSTWA